MSVNGTMKAAVCEALGAVQVRNVASPEVGPGNVLVRVAACGVNFVDVLMRRGDYAQSPTLPFVPGSELAGEVVAVGQHVHDRTPGDRVIAVTEGTGGFAEMAVVPAERVYRMPERFEYADGAAFLLCFLTAYIPLTRQVRVGPGCTVLVHAAAGGVGTAAVQIARHLGADVLATAGSPEKLAVAAELGARAGFDYTQGDIAPAVRDATDGRGVDVVVDPVGGELMAASIRMLAPLGTVVAVGYAGGAWPAVDPALLVGRNAGVVGIFLGRLMKLDPALVRTAADELLALWRDGAIAPFVGTDLPLADADHALDLLEQRRTTGKVVLRT